MAIFATMVMRNEAARYLSTSLAELVQQVDEVFVFDDRSVDDSREIASFFTSHVSYNKMGPTFLEHEGRFRAAAWSAFQRDLHPTETDWVLSIDADEFLVTDRPRVDAALQSAAMEAHGRGQVAVRLPIPEVWGWDGDVPLVRRDGFWASINGTRLFRYRHGGVFKDRGMGCGSEPTYVQGGPISENTCGISLMHFGYARDEDKQAKHGRYTALMDHGHSNSHVESILQPAVLEKWEGPVPRVSH